MIGLFDAVASASHMGVWGGRRGRFWSPPSRSHPGRRGSAGRARHCDLDGVLRHDQVAHAAKQGFVGRLDGEQSDGGAMIDSERSGEGVLLPIGGYKGAGLAIVLGLLAGPLNGAAFGCDGLISTLTTPTKPTPAISSSRSTLPALPPLDIFKAEVDRHLRDLRASKMLPGFDAVRLPGEQRRARRALTACRRRADAARARGAARQAGARTGGEAAAGALIPSYACAAFTGAQERPMAVTGLAHGIAGSHGLPPFSQRPAARPRRRLRRSSTAASKSASWSARMPAAVMTPMRG